MVSAHVKFGVFERKAAFFSNRVQDFDTFCNNLRPGAVTGDYREIVGF
jgi:hypothetical protein